MVEPLIRWLTASGKGYDIEPCGLKLAIKWYADDGILLTNIVEDMISLLDIIQHFSTWSSIHLNAARCNITAYIHELQTIPQKRDRDVALRSRLAHVTLAGRPIGALTQDEPLPGAYLGTSLTASRCGPNLKSVRLTGQQGALPYPPHKTTPLIIRRQLKDFTHSLPHGSLSTRHTGGGIFA